MKKILSVIMVIALLAMSAVALADGNTQGGRRKRCAGLWPVEANLSDFHGFARPVTFFTGSFLRRFTFWLE